MRRRARKILRNLRNVLWGERPEIPHGPKGIREVGHREYVGGLWREIGKLQFDFLVERGLQPHHYFLDVACGSLRAAIHFIPYLEAGHYLGIDKEADLIQAGVEQELGQALCEAKRPRLVVSSGFEFERLMARPDFALAHSLFTHLPPEMIHECFRKLRRFIKDDGEFYATFFESDTPSVNPQEPHDHDYFVYTRAEMEGFGCANGWEPTYIGDWNHPRRQVMVMFRPI